MLKLHMQFVDARDPCRELTESFSVACGFCFAIAPLRLVRHGLRPNFTLIGLVWRDLEATILSNISAVMPA